MTLSRIVSLAEAFNLIGKGEFGTDWDGSEVGAIRLGQRSNVNPASRQRGLAVRQIMMDYAQDGRLGLIYTDNAQRRVRYFDAPVGGWLRDIHPDPRGTEEGMIEVGDGDLYICVADVSALKRRSPMKEVQKAKPGPRSRYKDFEYGCRTFFETHSLQTPDSDVADWLRRHLPREAKRPSRSWGIELIGKAREAVKAARSES